MLTAAGISLLFFALLNIAKEANPAVKSFLNFYPPIGPLLGLFLFSTVTYIIFYYLLSALKPGSQKKAFWILLISSIAFFFLVFPPVFELIVALLKTQ